MSRKLVSICMITYNHEKYIHEAIQGVLSQKVHFSFEFIIANDASTDTTDTIIQNLILKNPDVDFKYFKHSENKGMGANFLFALDKCRGKYIALCEGDDFWTNPHKLQMQVDFMEEHTDYELCFTNISVIDSKGRTKRSRDFIPQGLSSFTHKDMPIWAPTLTRVFRNRNFETLGISSPGMDTLMLVYQSKFGKIKYLHQITGTYRIHDGGVYNQKRTSQKIEHKIRTKLACLPFVEVEFKNKYVGKILKELLELKKSDKEIYRTTRMFIKANVSDFKDMPSARIRGFWFCFYFIFFPGSENLSITKKFINRLLLA